MRRVRLILIVFLLGCTNNQVDLVTEEQMSIIMTDLILSDYTIRQFPTGMRDSIKIEMMQSLLKVHNLSEAQLDTNIYLYSVDFEKFESVLKLVEYRLDSLSELGNVEVPENVILPSKLSQ